MITLVKYSVGVKCRIHGVNVIMPIKKCVRVINGTFVPTLLEEICDCYNAQNLVVSVSEIVETEDKLSRIEGNLYFSDFKKDGNEYVKHTDIDIK